MSARSSITPTAQLPQVTKYEILEELGHGGMATVYRARDRRLDREVALKVIHRHLRENQEVAARFAAEARAVAKLRHRNIVEVYDVSEPDDPERYLVVELVRGPSLRRLLQRHPVLPPEVAAALGVELSGALEHAHQSGVIHRDIKPENVLLDVGISDGEAPSSRRDLAVKLTDFGIAKLLDGQGVTSTGQVLGSPAHMAPEQIEAGDVTARADVFALGVLLYECFCGKLPFDGKNPAQVLRRVLDGAFVPPERVRGAVGATFSRVVERALAKDPADRWESAAALGAALTTELAALGVDDSRAELAAFFAAPEAYVAEREPLIVARLLSRGRAARGARRMGEAAACLNRALSLRPADVALIREVHALTRGGRLRKQALRIGTLIGVPTVFGVATYAMVHAVRSSAPAPSAVPVSTAPRSSASASAARPAPSVAALTPSSAAAPSASARPAPSVVGRPSAVGPAPSAASPPSRTRPVRFALSPSSTKLLVDGAETSWFPAVRHALEVGRSYRLEFVPPNERCCKIRVSGVRVEPGESELVVSGGFDFKDSVLSAAALPVGTDVRCSFGSLAVQLKAPASRSVPMRAEKLVGQCAVLYPPESGRAPREASVTLQPGAAATLD